MTRPTKTGETSRVYIVHNVNTGAETLVRSTTGQAAARHVSQTDYRTAIASQRDLERLLTTGHSVVDLTTAPDQPELTLT